MNRFHTLSVWEEVLLENASDHESQLAAMHESTDPFEDADRNRCPNPDGRDLARLNDGAIAEAREFIRGGKSVDDAITYAVELWAEGYELSGDAERALRETVAAAVRS